MKSGEVRTSLPDLYEFLTVFSILTSYLERNIVIGNGRNIFGDVKFCENRHTLLMDFCPYFPHLLSHVCEIRRKKSAHSAVEHLCFS